MTPPWTVFPLALATLALGTLCLRAARPRIGGGHAPAAFWTALALASGSVGAATICVLAASDDLSRSLVAVPAGFYSLFVGCAFLVTRWASIVTRWHRPADTTSLRTEVSADFAAAAVAAAAQAALWSYSLPWLEGRGPSALLNAAFCVHAVTLLGVWAWMRRFYPPVAWVEGRGSQVRGALWYLAGIGLLLATFHLADFAPLAGLFSPENRTAVAVAGAFGMQAVLAYCVELSWQPE